MNPPSHNTTLGPASGGAGTSPSTADGGLTSWQLCLSQEAQSHPGSPLTLSQLYPIKEKSVTAGIGRNLWYASMSSESFTGKLVGSGSGGKVIRYRVLSSSGNLRFEAAGGNPNGPPTIYDEVETSSGEVRQAAKDAFEKAKETDSFMKSCLPVSPTEEQCAQLQNDSFTGGPLALNLGTCYRTIFSRWGEWIVNQKLKLELERIPDPST